jgi:hypothetical protein
MRLRQAAVGTVGVVLVAMAVAAGCSAGGHGDSAAGGGSEERVAPAADQAATPRDQAAAGAKSGGGGSAAPADQGGAGQAAAEVRLVDLGDRIVRTANVDLEVGEGELNKVVNEATDVVVRAKGIYVGSSTAVPAGEPASGQVTFRVPVDAFEPVLRQLKGLGTYRGEESSTDDVTTQYVDLTSQLTAWRAQERVYLRLLDRAKSVADVIAVQNQLQQVQSNIERLQGQVNHLEDQSSFSTIVLQLSEPGAAAEEPVGRLGRASAGRSGAPTTAARPRRSASPADPQAERMAGGVEVDADALLGLEVGEDRSGGDGAGAGGLQVVHLDVEVHLHPLVAGAGRPGRSDVGRLGLEGQPRPATGRAEGHPVGLVPAERPPQQLLVEAGQGARVGRVEHGGGQAHRRSLGHFASRIEPIPTTLGAYSPTRPSTDSRRRSAWPLCRAYSSIMWHRIHRRLGARPSGQVRWASRSRPPSASASLTRTRERATASCQSALSCSGLSSAAECQSQSRSAFQSTVSHGGAGSRPCSALENQSSST